MLVRAGCCYKALVYFLTDSFMCCRDENIISAVVGSLGCSAQWRSRQRRMIFSWKFNESNENLTEQTAC